MKKQFGLLSLALLLASSVFLTVVSPIAVNYASASCTDAQVDGWLASRGLARNQQTLRDAYQALGDCPTNAGIPGLVGQFTNILNSVIPFLISLAVFVLIYGIYGFMSSAGDEEKRKEARDFIVWGIISLFVMISVWGLVNILVKTFNLDTSTTIVTDRYGAPADLSKLPQTPGTVPELIDRINAVGTYVIPFLISIAVFIIILGMVNYVRQGDNEEKRAEARQFIIWGVISVFLMLSIWGLVNILVSTFNLDSTNKVPSLGGLFQNLRVSP